jgi:hypothetical protein
MINITYIYLITGIDNSPYKVYIGKTKSSRENDHKRKYGCNITYTIIDSIDSLNRKDWKPLESYWIEQFKVWGFDVMNKNNGGGGPEYLNDNQKQHLSNIRKGKKQSKEHKQKRLSKCYGPRKNTSNMHHPKPWIAGQRSIPILQLDKDNNVINEWDSQNELIRQGYKGISGALKDKRLYKEYYWKYKTLNV